MNATGGEGQGINQEEMLAALEAQDDSKLIGVSSDSATDENQAYEDRFKDLALKSQEQSFQDRIKYTRRLFWLMLAWMVAVLVVVVAAGFNTPTREIPSNVAFPIDLVAVVLSLLLISIVYGNRSCSGWIGAQLNRITKSHGIQNEWIRWCIETLLPFALLLYIAIRLSFQTNLILSYLSGFVLPTGIVITLIGSTTANVIGLFVIVVKYLFPKDQQTLAS